MASADPKYFEQVVLVLYMILLGLGIVQHLSNIGAIIRKRKEVQVSVSHWLWAALLFVLQTQMAEHIFGLRCHKNWSNGYVILALLNPLLAYLAVAFCFPSSDKLDQNLNLYSYFEDARRPFFLTLAALGFANLVTTGVFITGFEITHYQLANLGFIALLTLLAHLDAAPLRNIVSMAIVTLFALFSIAFASNFAFENPELCAAASIGARPR